jgi:hypothetical protein
LNGRSSLEADGTFARWLFFCERPLILCLSFGWSLSQAGHCSDCAKQFDLDASSDPHLSLDIIVEQQRMHPIVRRKIASDYQEVVLP